MVGIVLVSHSSELARGLGSLLGQVAGLEVRIECAGGGSHDELGTDAEAVLAAVERAETGDGVVVLADLGSSVLTVRHLLDEGTLNGHVRLADAPLVEGAMAAAVVASMGMDLESVRQAAEDAWNARKL
ncbi:MAG TPA: dihydroxyacetone kinase phosphoryl donor subunit DhaM [Candidatus Dormibacteraeota bacterium]